MALSVDTIIERSILLSLPIYRKQTVKWIKETRELKSYKSYVNLSPLPKSMQRLVEKSDSLAYLTGAAEVDAEIKATDQAEFTRDLKSTGIDEALRILKGKKVISPEEFKALTAELKSISFSVQRIERISAIIEVKKSLLRSMKVGAVFEEWRKDIPKIFVNYGITPLSPHHLETVFRNNCGGSYNIARFEKATRDPLVVFLKYLGIADGRQSMAICNPHFNKVYKKDDPIWQRISPLNHHKCRCTTGPVTKFKAERENIQPSDKPSQETLDAIPDDFKKSPQTMKQFDKKMKKVLKEREKYSKKLSKEISSQ